MLLLLMSRAARGSSAETHLIHTCLVTKHVMVNA